MNYHVDEDSKCIMQTPSCAEEWLQLIWEVGYDYDGYENNLEGLKSLVQELVEYAIKAQECLRENKVFIDDEENEKELKEACSVLIEE